MLGVHDVLVVVDDIDTCHLGKDLDQSTLARNGC